jgi:hypothetical protein
MDGRSGYGAQILVVREEVNFVPDMTTAPTKIEQGRETAVLVSSIPGHIVEGIETRVCAIECEA